MKKMMAANYTTTTSKISPIFLARRTTHSVNKEPMLANSLCIKEERCTDFGLGQEITRKRRDPFEDGETSAGFQDEERDGLLDEESDDNGRPGDQMAFARGGPETELEDEEAEDGDGAVAVFGVL